MKVLVTGVAGFIGFHTAARLIDRGDDVVGVDNLNDYYDVSLKEARLETLGKHGAFRFVRADLADRPTIAALFAESAFDRVIHLGAQAGVRYSIRNPMAYIDSNLVGFTTVLEGCRHTGVGHLVYASSSSVYGANTRTPFSVGQTVDHPVSLYAATKKANELLAHTYSHLYRLPTTGLRFFTVYGPWGRPDMAYFSFTRAILAGEPIEVYNNGDMARDFTYIDDIVEGIVRTVDRIAAPDPDWSSNDPSPATSTAPNRIYNIGNHHPERLLRMIEVLEGCLGKSAIKHFRPMQAGDVLSTHADVAELTAAVGFQPATRLEDGLQRFVDWYRGFYRV
jgi:UDP-glucuronate 4-epimerase